MILPEQNEFHIPCVIQNGGKIPLYQTSGSAGADICALLLEPFVLEPGKRIAVPTGVFMQIPSGYEVQVRPRSGLAVKYGITCLNTPGTIDSDYRGEVKVILINLGDEPFIIQNGDRIAQLVVAPVVQATFLPADELSDTERGCGGFGSTGTA